MLLYSGGTGLLAQLWIEKPKIMVWKHMETQSLGSCSACRNRNTFKSRHFVPHVAAFPATSPSSCAQMMAISVQYSSEFDLFNSPLTKLSLATRKSFAFKYSGLVSLS